QQQVTAVPQKVVIGIDTEKLNAKDFESLQSHIVQASKDLYGTAVSNEFAKAFEAHGYKPLQKVNQVIEVQ
ncbi:M4 family metallopeptidase, partial [Bacillus sp. HC-Mk]